jgi:5-methylcytosine-specific restriction endonuclease McrA
MPFPEKLKTEVREKTHLRCCICKNLGAEVHHIIPEEENGPDTVDNAVSLCRSCYDTYGCNPAKREFLRNARDQWYEICEIMEAIGPMSGG